MDNLDFTSSDSLSFKHGEAMTVYPSKLIIVYSVSLIMSISILVYAILIGVTVHKKNNLSDFHMLASLICILLNVLFQISGCVLNMLDLEETWIYRPNDYPFSN
jgi:hypothetical protein